MYMFKQKSIRVIILLTIIVAISIAALPIQGFSRPIPVPDEIVEIPEEEIPAVHDLQNKKNTGTDYVIFVMVFGIIVIGTLIFNKRKTKKTKQ